MGSSNEANSNIVQKKDNNPFEEKEEVSDIEGVNYSTFILQIFGKTKVFNIEKFKLIDINDFKVKILEFLNLKTISIEQIILFYREKNKLGYKIIDNITTLWKLKNSSIIKVKILNKNLINEEKNYLEKIKTDLITSMEIEDALIDNQKLKEKLSSDFIKDFFVFIHPAGDFIELITQVLKYKSAKYSLSIKGK